MTLDEREPLLSASHGSDSERRSNKGSGDRWIVVSSVVFAVVVIILAVIGVANVRNGVQIATPVERAARHEMRTTTNAKAAASLGEKQGSCFVEAAWYEYYPSKLPDSVNDPVTSPHLFQGFETGWGCPAYACPSGDAMAIDTPDAAPVDAKAHLFFIGDSTDKLHFHAACNLLLPENEQCDYQCTDPSTSQFPRNVRPHLNGEFNLSGPDCCTPEEGCCMSDAMVASSPACVPASFASGLGAVGDLHTCGVTNADANCNGVTGGTGVANVYAGDGLLPNPILERVATALTSFHRWTTETVGMNPPRPIVVIIQSGLWDIQGTSWNVPRGAPGGDPILNQDVVFDESNEEFVAFIKKYTEGLKGEYEAAKAALESVGAATDCIAFRTIDLFSKTPVVAESRRALLDAMSTAMVSLGTSLGVPVHRTEELARRVESETGGYWWDPMHQRSYSARLQVMGIAEFSKRCLPAHCALR